MIILSKEQIIALHSSLISETGGSDGIRDENLLESSISAPFQTFDNAEVFPSIQQRRQDSDTVLLKITPSLMATNESEFM